MKKHFANIITSLRLILSPCLFLFDGISTPFFVIYSLCGLSDMIDGTIARRTGTQSPLGEKLDTLGDFVFLCCAFLKLILENLFPARLLYAAAVVFLIKMIGLSLGLSRSYGVVTLHTKLNKLSGLILFLYPFTLTFPWWQTYAQIAVIVTALAALGEVYLIWKKPIDSPPGG